MSRSQPRTPSRSHTFPRPPSASASHVRQLTGHPPRGSASVGSTHPAGTGPGYPNPHPKDWIQKAFPNVLPNQGRAFRLDKDGNVTGITSDSILAECFGREGSPNNPIVYCPEEETFYHYSPDSGLYEKRDGEAVIGYIDSVLKRCAMECDPDQRDAVHKLRQLPRLRRIRDTIPSVSRLSVDRFREDRTKLHVADGVLDLRRLQLHPHSPFRPARWKLDVEWDAPWKLPRQFVGLLRTLFPHPSDRDLALSIMAMAFLGNPFQKVVLLIGAGGSGKSTFVKLMEELVGPHSCGVLRLLHANGRFESDGWEGKLLLHQPETTNRQLAKGTDVLKKLSGQDRLSVEKKHRNGKESFMPEALPVLSSNEELRVPVDGDESAWRRRLLVLDTSEACLPDDERIQFFEQKLLQEEGSGILRLVAGRARRLLSRLDAERGLPEPTDRQVLRVHSLLSKSDPFAHFVRQRVARAPDQTLYAGELKEAFKAWLASNDHPVPSRVQIRERIRVLVKKSGGTYTKSLPEHPVHSSRGWRGVTLS